MFFERARLGFFVMVAGLAFSLAACQKDDIETPSGPDSVGLPELPAYVSGGSRVYIEHQFTYNSRQVRNYSMLYDTDSHYPVWVAYPLHSSYIGSSGRGNNWGYDPAISTNLQPNLGTQKNGAGYGYDRGHMLPSASRTISAEANDQTFYYTNMCPQIGSTFNQSLWANVESFVRSQRGVGADTLYVVTGAVLQTVGGSETVKYVYSRHDPGKKIAVPNYFYKALLKSSSYQGKKYYKAICLWYEHKSYESGRGVKVEDCRTIRWLEEQTGIDFFANMREDIQDQVETTYTASAWSIR